MSEAIDKFVVGGMHNELGPVLYSGNVYMVDTSQNFKTTKCITVQQKQLLFGNNWCHMVILYHNLENIHICIS